MWHTFGYFDFIYYETNQIFNMQLPKKYANA